MAKKNNIGRRPTGTPRGGRRNQTADPVLEGDDTLVDVVEVRDQGLDFFERNRNAIVYGALAIAALVAIFFIYQTFVKAPAEQEAQAYLQKAQTAFEQDSFAIALEEPAPGAYGFLDIIDEFGGTEAGNLAQYYAAVSYLNLGRYEAAREFANNFDSEGTLLPAMKQGVLGDIESELGNMEAALSHYSEAVERSDKNYVTAGYYLNKLGQLYQHEGRTDEALTAFRRLKQDYGQSPLAAEANKFIGILEGVE